MKLSNLKRFLSVALSLGLLLAVTGCTADTSQITFLDFLNTVFLGITAAGGVVLIQNV